MPKQRRSCAEVRDPFTYLSVAITLIALLYVGAAVAAITGAGFSHFGEALTNPEVLFSLRMSLVTSTISTCIALALALPSAYALTRTRMPCKRLVQVIMELTLSLPYILLGFALLLIFSSPWGKALKEAGFPVVFRPAGIVFAQLIVNLPFALRMVRTAFIDVNPRVEFVARTLGAGPFAVFRTIIVPSCRNAIISTFILTWARGMGEFGATLMLVGVTRMRTETLPGSIYLSIQTGNNDTAMATAMIMLLVSAATLVVANVLNRPVGPTRMGSGREGGLLGRFRPGKTIPSAAGPVAQGQAAAPGTVPATAADKPMAPVSCSVTQGAAAVPGASPAARVTCADQAVQGWDTEACSVDIHGLEVIRGDFRLHDVDLAVDRREVFAILGRTGSGKTVLLESIAGAFPIETGSIMFDDADALAVPVQRRRMGIVYQDHALFPHMTVFDNVAYGLRRHGVGKREVEARVTAMLEAFGIAHLARKYPGVISGGESQRVALARALVLRPGLLLLDEPFASLDPTTKKSMYSLLEDIHRDFGCTIVFVTHDFREAARLADRVGIILNGELRATVPATELMGRSYDPEVSAFLGL